MFDNVTNQLIGTCGYHCWSQASPFKAEIGYDSAVAHRGSGADERGIAAHIEFGFGAMVLNIIEASVSPMNERSIRLLHRFGLEQTECQNELLWFQLRKQSALIKA